MNKYIEYLTTKEYEQILKWLKEIEPIKNEQMKKSQNTKDYVELRFTILKIMKILEKHKKTIDNNKKI